ncbi:unnamed protein product [Moneuplotes crassus]|uniref:Uncharacterized protein n=1 Tax=Euplotes crassus TaxID=5936 RepID=A0AAD2D786_EUPCR|nr:unnamed protein product [Moneuplotes crassus]
MADSSLKSNKILITNPYSKDKVPEITVIEMQGSVENTLNKDFRGLDLGKLKKNSIGKYELLIENSKLTGEFVKLENPQIILAKEDGQLVVKAIIKEKILFSKRPAPVIKRAGSPGSRIKSKY